MLANGKLFHGDHHPVSVVQGRKSRNLIPFPFRQGDYTGNGITYTPNSDGSILVKGTKSGSHGDFSMLGNWGAVGNSPYTAGDTLTISGSIAGMYVSIYFFKNGSNVGGIPSARGNSATITVPDHDGVNVFTGVYNGEVVDAIIYPMLNTGTTAAPYEPYGTVTDTIFKPTNLKKSGTDVTFEKSYNHTAEVEVHGSSTQDGTPTPDNPVRIESIDSVELVSRNADGTKTATRTIDLQGNQLRSLPDGTKDELLVHRDGRVELVQVGYPFNSTIGVMNNNDQYPGWKSSAFNDEIGDGLNASVFCFSNIGGLRLSGDMAHRIGVNTRSRPGAVWFYDTSFGMTQSEMIAKYPNTEVEMYIKRTEPKVIQLPSISPLPTYWPTTVIYDQDGNDISAFVKVVE